MARGTQAHTVLTSRGTGLLAAGVVVGALGMGLASPPLVYVGVAMVSVAIVGGLWMLLAVDRFLRTFPVTRREVVPRPLTVGVPGTVTVTIEASPHGNRPSLARAFTNSLDIREQAAAELTGAAGAKATVSRSPTSLRLTYQLLPSQRGRWPLGPALVHSSDPLGVMWTDTSMGESEKVPVWPVVEDLSATAGALMGQADRVVLGARSPSPDDAALRDYREGDDLRRVHWPSTARTGTMLVRSDERAGRRPATVIMDLPRDPVALEWTISAGASIALSVLDAGHPVRLLGGTLDPESLAHTGHQHPEAARAAVLDLTVDLAAPASRAQGLEQVRRAARQAADDASHGEVLVGLFEPLDKASLDVILPLAGGGRAWAIVRAAREEDTDAQDTASALRRAGWRTIITHAGADLESMWTRLLTAGDIE